MSDEERQADELLVLENIYTEEEFKPLKENDELGGHFLAFLLVEGEIKLLFKDLREPEGCFQEHLLNHLPPLSLLFSFPKDYPSSQPANFTLSCQWLQRRDISKICRKLDELWNEYKGMEIIYIWTQFLKEEALKFLGIDKELDISKMYTYYLKYMEYLTRTSKGLPMNKAPSNRGRRSVQVPVEQRSMQEGAKKSASLNRNEECGEQSRLLAYGDYDAGDNCFEGDGQESSPVKLTEERKLVEDALQNPCSDTKPAKENSENNLSKEMSVCKNETRYNRKHRPSMEREDGKKNLNVNLKTNVEFPAACDTNKLCEAVYTVSRTELNDTVNRPTCKTNWDASFRSGQRWGANRVSEVKQIKHNNSSAEHTVVNELNKTDMATEQVSTNMTNTNTTTSVRGSVKAKNRRYTRRPRSGSAEQEKGTRWSEVKKEDKIFDRRAIVDLSPETSVIQHLVDYNNKRRESEFERSLHTCKICFEDKLGIYCMKFEPCRHVFCSSCINNYFEVRIMEGTVLSIPCPEDKCPSEAQPSHVRALVSSEMYVKYDSILLSAALDTQPDVMYCPRRQCQYPVFREDKDDKLATCPECNYAFCVLCEKVYHGVAPCVIISEVKRELVQEFLEANNEHKKVMEAKYGKQHLKNLVDIFHTVWCESWIRNNSKKCPHCGTSIEKASGCNKIQCWKCDTVFCWLCSMKLDKLEPYHHFNDTKSLCFNSLFEGVIDDEEFDENVDEEFIEDED